MTDNQGKRKTLGLKSVPDYIQKLQELKSASRAVEKTQEATHNGQDVRQPYYKRESVQKALAWLYNTFPKCFSQREQKPLKINITDDIFNYLLNAENKEELPSKSAVRKALTTYTHNRFYLKECVLDAYRIDLNGETTTTITQQEADYAKEIFDRYNAAFKEKKKLKHRGKRKEKFNRQPLKR
jgi:sRNA-binding protein